MPSRLIDMPSERASLVNFFASGLGTCTRKSPVSSVSAANTLTDGKVVEPIHRVRVFEGQDLQARIGDLGDPGKASDGGQADIQRGRRGRLQGAARRLFAQHFHTATEVGRSAIEGHDRLVAYEACLHLIGVQTRGRKEIAVGVGPSGSSARLRSSMRLPIAYLDSDRARTGEPVAPDLMGCLQQWSMKQ